MKLLLDEMHAPSIAEALTIDSWDVVAVAAAAELRGKSDEEVLTYAASTGRSLVTEHVVDYATLSEEWAGDGRPHAGLVFTNPRRFNRATIAYPGNLITALGQFLADPPIQGESWIWWL